MRKIKFRALSQTINGTKYWDYYSIGQNLQFNTDLETVGQFTGLKDKNGKEIYEHDIVKLHAKPMLAEMIGPVIFGNYGNLCCQFVCCERLDGGGYRNLTPYEDIEIIGNIWENPELLEGVKK